VYALGIPEASEVKRIREPSGENDGRHDRRRQELLDGVRRTIRLSVRLVAADVQVS